MARKADDKTGAQTVGGLSAIRREMLHIIREEQEEQWQSLDYKGIQARRLYSATCASLVFTF